MPLDITAGSPLAAASLAPTAGRRRAARPAPAPGDVAAERAWLDGLRRRYHHRRYVHPDPLEFLYGYADPRDREIVGLVASSLAYGNVKAMLPAIATVLDTLGPTPAATLRRLPPSRIRSRLGGFRYRFTTGVQLAGLLAAAQRLVADADGLGGFFAAHGTRSGDTSRPVLTAFVAAMAAAAPCSLAHLLPHPEDGSACKRLNLFLRWMVRRDAVDPGGWRVPRPHQLLMPLDTHVHRTALARGWTTRRSADLRTVLEVTAALRAIAPRDPLRYDFAITRPGILRAASPPAGREIHAAPCPGRLAGTR